MTGRTGSGSVQPGAVRSCGGRTRGACANAPGGSEVTWGRTEGVDVPPPAEAKAPVEGGRRVKRPKGGDSFLLTWEDPYPSPGEGCHLSQSAEVGVGVGKYGKLSSSSFLTYTAS